MSASIFKHIFLIHFVQLVKSLHELTVQKIKPFLFLLFKRCVCYLRSSHWLEVRGDVMFSCAPIGILQYLNENVNQLHKCHLNLNESLRGCLLLLAGH